MPNKERDLLADLRICEEATSGPWIVDKYNESQVRQPNYSKRRRIICPSDAHGIIDARFTAEAREGWPYAIRRLLEAEKERDELRKIVSSECPVDALDIVNSLRVEKWHMQERIAELEAKLKALNVLLNAVSMVVDEISDKEEPTENERYLLESWNEYFSKREQIERVD